MSKSYKIKKRRKKKPGFLLALLTNRAPCFPLEKHVPQISTGALHGKPGETAMQSYDLCPFSVKSTLNKHSSPGFTESLTTSHTRKQERTPRHTAIYLLKSLWVLDFSEAPTLTPVVTKASTAKCLHLP